LLKASKDREFLYTFIINNQIITMYYNLIAFIADIKPITIIPYTKYFILKRYIFSSQSPQSLLVTPKPLSTINLIFSSLISFSSSFSSSSGVKVNCFIAGELEYNLLLIGIRSNFLLKSSSVCLTAFSILSSLCVIG